MPLNDLVRLRQFRRKISLKPVSKDSVAESLKVVAERKLHQMR